jgi:protein O-GlcNAc transferase
MVGAANRGEFAVAISEGQRLLVSPGNPPAVAANLAYYYCELREWESARSSAEAALAVDDRLFAAWTNLSWALCGLGRYRDAEVAARRSLELFSENPQALNNLANSLKGQGRIDEAFDIYVAVYNDYSYDPLFASNLMLALQYSDKATAESIIDWAKKVGRDLVAWTGFPEPLTECPLKTERGSKKIRLGLLSPDLNDHAVMYFLEPLLANIDRNRFEVVCLYLNHTADNVTSRVKRYAEQFFSIAGLKPHKQAQIIRDTQVDFLLELAGHTAKNGLAAMAHKPAPLQGTWLGYPGTTGLTSIDLRFTDIVVDQNFASAEYCERLIHFTETPFCVYRPCIRQPLKRYWREFLPWPTPALLNAHITFGCCNNITKLTPSTLKLWSSVLFAIPSSKLLIEGKEVTQGESKEFLNTRFEELGVSRDRLIFVERDTKNQYLTYRSIDIALDTAPLTGGATSADVLWYGVPLVTLAGRSFRERMSASFLTHIGRTEWIAETPEDFLRICVDLASDISRLNKIRLGMRAQVESSPMMDERKFARQFEDAIINELKTLANLGPDQGIDDQEEAGYAKKQLVFLDASKRMSLGEAHQQMKEYVRQRDWSGLSTLCVSTLESIPNEASSLCYLAAARWNLGDKQRAQDYLIAAERSLVGDDKAASLVAKMKQALTIH